MIQYYKLRDSPDVYEVNDVGQAKPVSAAELAQRGVPVSNAVVVDPVESTDRPRPAQVAPPADTRPSVPPRIGGLAPEPDVPLPPTVPTAPGGGGGGLQPPPTEGTPAPPTNGGSGPGQGGGGGGGTPGDGSGGEQPGTGGEPDNPSQPRNPPSDDPRNPPGSGAPGSGVGEGNGGTTINIGARDTKPSITLNPTIGDAAPVQERTAQGLNLHRDAPTAFQHPAFTIPPPPAPPQVPEATGMLGDVEAFARDAMANPNRYSSDWMTKALAAMNGQITNSRAEGLRTIAEQMASRGLVGSGMELTQDASLEGQLDQNRLNYLADLAQQMAAVDAQDRQTAGNLGVQAGQLGIDAARFKNDGEYRNAVLTEQGAMDRSNLQLNQQDLELRAHQIQQDAIQRGQAMDLDEAMDQARRQVDLDRIAVEERSAISDERLKELALLLQAMQAYQ